MRDGWATKSVAYCCSDFDERRRTRETLFLVGAPDPQKQGVNSQHWLRAHYTDPPSGAFLDDLNIGKAGV